MGKDGDVADWSEGKVGQRSRVRASAVDPLGLQQLSDSSENLSSRTASSTVMPLVIVSRESRQQEKTEKNIGNGFRQSTLHPDVNIIRTATGLSSSTGKAGIMSDRKERVSTVPENLMSGPKSLNCAPSSSSGGAVIGSQSTNQENEQDLNSPRESNAEKSLVTTGSLAGMVGRAGRRKKLRLGS